MRGPPLSQVTLTMIIIIVRSEDLGVLLQRERERERERYRDPPWIRCCSRSHQRTTGSTHSCRHSNKQLTHTHTSFLSLGAHASTLLLFVACLILVESAIHSFHRLQLPVSKIKKLFLFFSVEEELEATEHVRAIYLVENLHTSLDSKKSSTWGLGIFTVYTPKLRVAVWQFIYLTI